MLYFIKIGGLEKGRGLGVFKKTIILFHEDYFMDFRDDLKHYSVILPS